ncbi:MAG: aspartate-semialdehyde dehydrogenase [Planctomycetota bacterium]
MLEERGFPLREMRLFASPRSAGRILRFRGEELKVTALQAGSLRGLDLVWFSAGPSVAIEHALRAAREGAVVIDNSSAFRMDPRVPLIVPEVNGRELSSHSGIVANPNCTTIMLVLALAPLRDAAGVHSVVVSTYQAAAGAGFSGLRELKNATAVALTSGRFAPRELPQDLGFNLFPAIGGFQEDGFSQEEDKLLNETRKILSLDDLRLEATCVRVPIERGHSLSVSAGLRRPLSPRTARALLRGAPGLEVVDDPELGIYPMPKTSGGKDLVAVGRMRASRVFDPGLAFWLCGDSLRKGAALNAVQIGEMLQPCGEG